MVLFALLFYHTKPFIGDSLLVPVGLGQKMVLRTLISMIYNRQHFNPSSLGFLLLKYSKLHILTQITFFAKVQIVIKKKE